LIYLDASALVTLLVSYDKRMLQVAQSVGLPTGAPGADEIA
jgi:predicted nucleic acid-binding protein